MNKILFRGETFFKGFPFAVGHFIAIVLFLLFSGHSLGGQSKKGAGNVSLDFVDTHITDVARSISLAYDIPILVDEELNLRVTFHLEGVGLMEGVSALCSANGLTLAQEESVFHIRRAVNRGKHEFFWIDSLITLSVKDKNVREFIAEFSANTGLNILADSDLEGNISGTLRNVSPENAFRSLMKVHGFRVWREDGFLRVEKRNALTSGLGGKGTSPQIRVERNGNLFSLESSGGELSGVLKELSDAAEINLALYGDIRETVHLKFNEVPLNQLVDALFKGKRFSYSLDSTSLQVFEGGSRKALSQTKLFPLKHVNCEKALAYFAKFMPNENFAITEVREQNALLLGGSPSEIQMAENLLELVDVPALQITLSCIVVEFKRGKGFEIGLHSGSTRKTGSNDVGLRGYLDFLSSDFSASGAFGKIGLLPDRFELELASMEENNQAEVLARPRLTTLNGNKAELNVTNTVYYLVSQVSADGFPITDYRSFNDGISLEMTPSVTQDGNITLEVSPEIKTAGRSTGDGPRDISTRNLKTAVVLKDGETLCLGGLIRKSKSEVRSAVPFLGSIPLVGTLFSYVSEVEEENELAIFITPHVER